MRRLKPSRKSEAMIPTASMADIAFLLIIFFMVTTVYDVDRTNVNLPLSEHRVDVARGSAYVVLAKITENNVERLAYKFSDGEAMSKEVGGPRDIYLEASRLAYADPTLPFVIKADGTLRFALIDEVMDELRKAGVQNLLLLTQQEQEG